MGAPTFRFRHRWHVPVERADAYAVLSDLADYPRWWPQVQSVERIDDSTAAVVCRSLLPYRLRFRMRVARQDPDAGVLEARLSGDLEGWCRWSLAHSAPPSVSAERPAPGGTTLLFEQVVVTPNRLLRSLAVLGRPALRLNHTWMMRSGHRGLLRHLCADRPP